MWQRSGPLKIQAILTTLINNNTVIIIRQNCPVYTIIADIFPYIYKTIIQFAYNLSSVINSWFRPTRFIFSHKEDLFEKKVLVFFQKSIVPSLHDAKYSCLALQLSLIIRFLCIYTFQNIKDLYPY